jgi:hypothetical protein
MILLPEMDPPKQEAGTRQFSLVQPLLVWRPLKRMLVLSCSIARSGSRLLRCPIKSSPDGGLRPSLCSEFLRDLESDGIRIDTVCLGRCPQDFASV